MKKLGFATVGTVTVALSLACGSRGDLDDCHIAPTISLTYEDSTQLPPDGQPGRCVTATVTGTWHGTDWDQTVTPTMTIPEIGWSITNPGFASGSSVFLNTDTHGVAVVIVCGPEAETATATVEMRDWYCDSNRNEDGQPLSCQTDDDCNAGEACMDAGGDSGDLGGDGQCRIEKSESFAIDL